MATTGRKKGTPKTGGRKKGTANKVTADVRAMVLTALEGVGGQEYLQQQARDNPSAFLTLVGKCLPTQMQGDQNNPLVAHINIGFGSKG